MRGRIFALPATLALCCALTGCSGLASTEQKSVYHDDNRIARETDTYTALNLRGFHDDSADSLSVGELTGSITRLRLSVPEEGGEFRVDYDVAVRAGDFKIVFVDGEHVDIVCEGSGSGSRTFTLHQGAYALKVVGKHAGAEIALDLEATEGITAKIPGDAFDDARTIELEPLEGDV